MLRRNEVYSTVREMLREDQVKCKDGKSIDALAREIVDQVFKMVLFEQFVKREGGCF